MTRSTLSITIDTIRSQAALTATYFDAKRGGSDELTLRRLQRNLEDGAVAALSVADGAEALERTALRAVEGQLSALRLQASDHPETPSPAA